jgi:hypothetical protein
MGEIMSFYLSSFVAAKLCGYCGRRLSFFGGRLDSKVKDYIVPLSKEGEDVPENTVACCKECQLLKGDYFSYALLPFPLNRSRLIADISRYLSEVREVLGSRSSIVDLPHSRR